jgi:hypothetical protein
VKRSENDVVVHTDVAGSRIPTRRASFGVALVWQRSVRPGSPISARYGVRELASALEGVESGVKPPHSKAPHAGRQWAALTTPPGDVCDPSSMSLIAVVRCRLNLFLADDRASPSRSACAGRGNSRPRPRRDRRSARLARSLALPSTIERLTPREVCLIVPWRGPGRKPRAPPCRRARRRSMPTDNDQQSGTDRHRER